MSAPNPRKRGAPGAAPAMSFPHQQFASNPPVNDQLMRWNNNSSGNDMSGFMDGSNSLGVPNPMANPYDISQFAQQSSNSLARRPMNALIPTNPNFASGDGWTGLLGEDGALIAQPHTEEGTETDNIELLEEKAQKAKRDAQGKRKQIPPFVQKLSSFLEEGKNEDLIRWSQKGDSFIVIDEDEFAKTLIPELFKHNNYASFVRQLNMYGFHKRVGLSDNSMRASERKNKSPSEYSNPYFRRGHPNLLWLINKPKSGSKAKKGGKSGDGEADSDEENTLETQNESAAGGSNLQAGKALPAAEQPPLHKKEVALIREELRQLKDSQKMVMGALTRMQRNNSDLYNQALMFQSQHDRHQNSINAILNFLANVFRKTLEDQGGNSQNVGDIISSLMSSQAGQQATGNVVDLGDFIQNQGGSNPMSAPHKRARGLLPPIPNQDARASTSRSPSTGSASYSVGKNSPMGHVTELVDSSPAETPPNLRQELASNPHERMMKIINDHNATNTSGMDLPDAAELVANAPNTLNNDQRSRLVDLMANQTSSPSIPSTTATASAPSTNAPNISNTSATPPPEPPSLSPIMRSPAMQPPSIHQINANQSELEELQRIQSEQAAKINELTDMLGPLSPSGRIPGLGDGGEDQDYFDPPNVDLDQYFDSNAFLNDANFGDGTDFNFNLDGGGGVDANGGVGGGLEVPGVGAHSGPGTGNNTPSPAGTEEIPRVDFEAPSVDRSGKRRRVG